MAAAGRLSGHLLSGAILSLLASALARSASAATYYVAPGGSDTGSSGAIGEPFASMGHAQAVANAGDIFYFRGGTYAYTAGTSTCSSGTATINAVLLNVSGASDNPITYAAYAGETPVFDFSGIPDSCRITGIRVTASYIHLKGLEIQGVPQNNSLNHESWGVWNSGSNNVFELLNLHDNMGPGLFIQNGSNNSVLNCDSHDNFDPRSSGGPGGNADGFGCHVGGTGTGNVFRGCRAWFNSDDGYDLIQAQVPVLIEDSWAFNNGYLSGTTTSSGGDGNGFKAGGYGLPQTNVPANPPQHTVRNCVAFLNRASGFYANHHPVGNFWQNNTAFNNNSANFNMLGYAGTAAVNVGILRNNVAFMRTAISNGTGGGVDDQFNSWDASLGLTVSATDFESISTTGWDGPRNADGSLPSLQNLHLQTGSPLIDRGTDVGLPYAGAAPDLGAFETGILNTGGTGTGGAGTGGTATNGGAAGSVGASGAGAGGTPASGGVAGSPGATGASMAGNSGLGGSTSTGGATGAAGGNAGSSSIEPTAPSKDDAGCACRTSGGSGRAPHPLLLSLVLLLRLARRRGRSQD